MNKKNKPLDTLSTVTFFFACAFMLLRMYDHSRSFMRNAAYEIPFLNYIVDVTEYNGIYILIFFALSVFAFLYFIVKHLKNKKQNKSEKAITTSET